MIEICAQDLPIFCYSNIFEVMHFHPSPTVVVPVFVNLLINLQ